MKKILFVGLLIAAIVGTTPLVAEDEIAKLVNPCKYKDDGDLCSFVTGGTGRCRVWKQFIVCIIGDQFHCDKQYIGRDCKFKDRYGKELDGKCVEESGQYLCDWGINCRYRNVGDACKCDDGSGNYKEGQCDQNRTCDCRTTEEKAKDEKTKKCNELSEGTKPINNTYENPSLLPTCKRLRDEGCEHYLTEANNWNYQSYCVPAFIKEQNLIECSHLLVTGKCEELKAKGCDKLADIHNNESYQKNCLGASLNEIDCEQLFLSRNCKELKERGCEKYYENNKTYRHECLGEPLPEEPKPATKEEAECEMLAKSGRCIEAQQKDCVNKFPQVVMQWWMMYCQNRSGF